MFGSGDLIVAPATGDGPGARAIVRIAGDGLEELLTGLVTAEPPGFAATGGQPRVVAARLAAAGLGRDWGPLPVEILHWPGPGGPLGGPLAEVQVPGSGPLVAAVVAEVCRLGARLARGGEFTLRAFLAGRLDLLQAEAVVAVVDARSPAELAAALDRLAGGAGEALSQARGELVDLVADIEAAIDFADETTPDAVPAGPAWDAVAARIAGCEATVARVAADLGSRDAAGAELPLVVLAGPPNIGKSSLLNALVGREAALVADETGTTRDWLEARLGDATGPRCILVDVAGLPAAGERLVGSAAEAAARARDAIARADLVLACRDAAAGGRPELITTSQPAIAVLTRCDLAERLPAGGGIATSSRTGGGIAELRAAILSAVERLARGASPATLRLAVGCQEARAALTEAAAAVAAATAGAFVDESLVAARLREAAAALADVTGADLGPDLLDRIFSRHCIGK